ncbi:MAG: orotidine-5'-phosphate decarboxylase [Labilithrix sp.]|nr:orotidine-5'-phosphate decarboxylase [Labilithrix sp.]MBX3224704.1 orotidine-5'-phosphate decarboxylase [Labilithrix sp.]
MPSPIVFALDFAGVDEARAAAAEVAPAVGMLKVGLELFVHAGPAVLDVGRELGLPVFLDLKLHDIPETVERAVAQASRLGARLVTVHASGGRAMLRRAVERAAKEGGTLSVCAVTILTSLDDADLDDVGITVTRRLPAWKPAADGSHAPDERPQTSLAAESLARLAYEEGVRWFVCSPAEVASLRQQLGPDAVLVTPGVRPATAAHGDQKRTATPAQAIRDGADWLVVGRPIRDASDRRAAAQAIRDEATAASGATP